MRIALGIEYDGHEFFGWQSQDKLQTVQGCLEGAVATIADEKISLICAGRTDAGVHAIGQVVHFDTNAKRHPHAWTLGTRALLPATISVRWSQSVDDDFHARFSARARSYRYIIYNSPIRTAILASRVTCYPHPLDIERMRAALPCLLGRQDFSSFRSTQCQSKTPIRNIHTISITRQEDFVLIDLKANAFLHHMVRNITGVLLRIGSGRLEPAAMLEIMQAKDRRMAFETALPNGLYFVEVDYPEPYAFPKTPHSLLFF
jgi:tRNA pseudouridine38-40 synthase